MTPSIIVHGGAGMVEDERRAVAVAGVERAAQAGWQLLKAGGSALDAVEEATRVLEEDPEFNAGYGSVLNRLGIVEVDAGIMDGTLRCGAVAAVPWMRHPISLARRLLEEGEHVMLAGGGARLYARNHGFPSDPPESMISPRAQARHERAVREQAEKSLFGPPPFVREPHDTVGACAVDAHGKVAAATSTGGTPWKRPGRVGDSPFPGAGLYADDECGAASATGHGESILRVGLCRTVGERLRSGLDPDRAARVAVNEMVARTGGEGGVIVVGKDGQLGHFSSTPRMPWAAVADGRLESGAEHMAAAQAFREAAIGDCEALALAVAGQPLFVRYGTSAERLAVNLRAGLRRGDDLILAEREGRMAGLAWCQRTGTFGLGGYLRLIALAPGQEGGGLGGQLLDEVERRVATASRSIFLLVSSFNAAARRFYANRGYREVGTLPSLVRADIDEVIAWKKLR